MTRRDPTDEQLLQYGRALKAMRERAGLTQSEAAGALSEMFPDFYRTMSSQAWGQYERGEIKAILEASVQERFTAALEGTPAELERDRARLNTNIPVPHLRLVDGMRERDAPAFDVPMSSRVRWSEDAALAYDIARPDARQDLSWLFGGQAGSIRVASDHLADHVGTDGVMVQGYVNSGQSVIFDRLQSPLPGRGCVVEATTGESFVYLFRAKNSTSVSVYQLNPPAEVEFPLPAVKGVYAVRLRGQLAPHPCSPANQRPFSLEGRRAGLRVSAPAMRQMAQ
jgi:transcriptional regulator with XRE-family HTH domain